MGIFKIFKKTNSNYENTFSIKTIKGINILDPFSNKFSTFKTTAITGITGSGKSISIFYPIIEQSIQNGFAVYLYDYNKNPETTNFAYNAYLKHYNNYKIKPVFNIINFDNPEYTNRCNPLQPDLLIHFIDAVEAAKAIIIGFEKNYQADEFSFKKEIHFLAICIWALKLKSDEVEKEYQLKKENLLEKNISKKEYERELKIIENDRITYCTLPHVIELINIDSKLLYHFLLQFEDFSIKNTLTSFFNFKKQELELELEKFIAPLRNKMLTLASPKIYYVMTTATGRNKNNNIFIQSLQINNPKKPQILCLHNNPKLQALYSPCISLYNSQILKTINKVKQMPTSIVCDEFQTLKIPKETITNLLATAQGKKIAIWLGFQNFPSLYDVYKNKTTKEILNLVSYIITGALTMETTNEIVEWTKRNNPNLNFKKLDLMKLKPGCFAGIPTTINTNIPKNNSFSSFSGKIKINNKKLKTQPLPKITDFKKVGLNVDKVLKYNMMEIIKQIKDLTNI